MAPFTDQPCAQPNGCIAAGWPPVRRCSHANVEALLEQGHLSILECVSGPCANCSKAPGAPCRCCRPPRPAHRNTGRSDLGARACGRSPCRRTSCTIRRRSRPRCLGPRCTRARRALSGGAATRIANTGCRELVRAKCSPGSARGSRRAAHSALRGGRIQLRGADSSCGGRLELEPRSDNWCPSLRWRHRASRRPLLYRAVLEIIFRSSMSRNLLISWTSSATPTRKFPMRCALPRLTPPLSLHLDMSEDRISGLGANLGFATPPGCRSLR